MNPAHAHLIMNHLPVLGVPFGVMVLIYGLARKSDEVKKLGLLVLILAALASAPVYLTGLWAKDQVENLPGISSGLIDAHHDAATVALVSAILLGVLSLAGLTLYRKKPRLAGALLWASLASALAVSALFAWTGNLGGQIHHPEIRTTAAQKDR
jgi:uncharacterized membrane protein